MRIKLYCYSTVACEHVFIVVTNYQPWVAIDKLTGGGNGQHECQMALTPLESLTNTS